MLTEQPNLAAEVGYAMTLANGSYDWYREKAILCRRAYRISETMLLVIAAAIPLSVALEPANATVPAILGALIVVGSGLRALFHWQENYIRFSRAREAVEAERRLYYTSAEPYDDPATRDRLLAAMVSRIEQEEMSSWVKLAAARPKQ